MASFSVLWIGNIKQWINYCVIIIVSPVWNRSSRRLCKSGPDAVHRRLRTRIIRCWRQINFWYILQIIPQVIFWYLPNLQQQLKCYVRYTEVSATYTGQVQLRPYNVVLNALWRIKVSFFILYWYMTKNIDNHVVRSKSRLPRIGLSWSHLPRCTLLQFRD